VREPDLVLAELARLEDDGPSPLSMPQTRPSTQTRAKKQKRQGKGRRPDMGPDNHAERVEGWHEARGLKSARLARTPYLGRWAALTTKPRPLLAYERWPGLVDWAVE
jgi:hypothetical protein